MPRNIYEVVLTAGEIEILKSITHKGAKHSARTIMHANVLLKTNDGDIRHKKDHRTITEIFGISPTTVNQIRKTYATEGLKAALNRKTRYRYRDSFQNKGDFEAQVIATVLSPAPKGKARWTLRLLTEHCADNKYIVSISHTAIGGMLNTKKLYST